MNRFRSHMGGVQQPYLYQYHNINKYKLPVLKRKYIGENLVNSVTVILLHLRMYSGLHYRL